MAQQATSHDGADGTETDVDALYDKFQRGDTLDVDELRRLQDAGLLEQAGTTRNRSNRCRGCGREGYRFSCPYCDEGDL